MVSDDDSDTSAGEGKLRWVEEQLAFLERELEHQKDRISELWSDLRAANQKIRRLSARLDELTEGEGE